jgi:hypothetical protein
VEPAGAGNADRLHAFKEETVSYDFTDQKIVDMVQSHRPTQTWSMAGPVGEPFCVVCGDVWPCQPIRELRAWQKKQIKDHYALPDRW